jgi:uncharacterized membrane protein YedE/YeeE
MKDDTLEDTQSGTTADFVADNWMYMVVGIYFGFVLTMSEAVSWFRIQEMFRFQDFHMYGIIGTAVVTAAIAVWAIKKWNVKTIDGNDIHIPPKEMGSGTRYWLGGGIFGLGWALTGACPGPMFALVGYGVPVILVSVVFAVLGTWTYGTFRSRLPH